MLSIVSTDDDVCREFQSYSHCNICFKLFPFSFTTIQIVV